MSDTQLHFAVGLPTIVALIGILVNVGYFVALNGRVTALDARFEARISSLEHKLDTRFDLLLSKVVEIDNRLGRVEERLKMNP